MKGIFLRIYIGLLLIVLLVGSLSYISVNVINHWRLNQYMESVAQGTFGLIADGIGRHQGEQRDQWLGAVQRLTQMEMELVPNTRKLERNFSVETDFTKRTTVVWQTIPGLESHLIRAELKDIDEPLARVTALLILNELGRYKKEERDATFEKIKQSFGFEIERKKTSELKLNATQSRRLARGDVFVSLEGGASSEPYLFVYAPYGRTGDVLLLGPVLLFEPYPVELISVIGVLALCIVGIAGYVLVRPLEIRLKDLMTYVDNIGHAGDLNEINLPGDDGLSQLAEHINSMSQRIHQLLKSQRDLTQAVSHELRTPVARLRFRMELLEKAVDSEQRAERIAGMQKDIIELNSLIDEILNYAKLESSQPDLQLQHIRIDSLKESIQKQVELMQGDIQFSVYAEVDQCWADEHYLHRVLQNLIGNAFRYADSEVSLTISPLQSGTLWRIEDDGPGIPEEFREVVFNAFSRVDSSRNRQSGGYGLGLAIVKQIIVWHGGELSVGDSQLGGARLEFILPELGDSPC